jgi:hypothetical protein
MEADDLGPVGLDDRTGRGVERRTSARCLLHLRIEAGLGIVAGEAREPRGLA